MAGIKKVQTSHTASSIKHYLIHKVISNFKSIDKTTTTRESDFNDLINLFCLKLNKILSSVIDHYDFTASHFLTTMNYVRPKYNF